MIKKETKIDASGIKISTYPDGRTFVIHPLPQELKEKAVNLLRDELDDEDKKRIMIAYNQWGADWPRQTGIHMNFGMGIRNLLRSEISDMQLPKNTWVGSEAQNWDDYYCLILEIFAGVKSIDGYWGEGLSGTQEVYQ